MPQKKGLSPFSVLVSTLIFLFTIPPVPLEAQFGRNKVQYESFDFNVIHTPHYNIFFYPEEKEAVLDASRMAERWNHRLQQVFNHELTGKKPIVLYANHPDFQQTNVISGFISEGVGGVTESLKDRVAMPLTGIYKGIDHVLGHELVHSYQYDIASSTGTLMGSGRSGAGGMRALPLWLVEGMAEYLSVGRVDVHTAMWIRDAALRGDLPTINDLSENPRYFPYRYGQALFAYIGGRWGDRAVTDLYKVSLEKGWHTALREVLHMTEEALSAEWLRDTRSAYLPLMSGRDRPEDFATPILTPDIDSGEMNVGPAISPDGNYVAFYSEQDLFEIKLFLADAHTGEVLEELVDSESDPHFDALSFLESGGAWSPDGSQLAFTVFAKGDNALAILDVDSRDVINEIRPQGVGAIRDPSWSPDGEHIVFSGIKGGISDLYLWRLSDNSVRQLTNDKHADIQPSWSPDGSQVVFSTDRSSATNFETLEYGDMILGVYDMNTNRVSTLEIFDFGKHINAHFTPDGSSILFIAAPDGFSNIYRYDTRDQAVYQVSNIATGISGITDLAPALTVSRETGDILFSVFSDASYNVYRLSAERTGGFPVTPPARIPMAVGGAPPAAVLPPHDAVIRGLVPTYLADALTGLPQDTAYEITDYKPKLTLDYIGNTSLGVASDPFGTAVGGSASFYFSDLLGNRNLGVTAIANGGIKDLGGQVVYVDREGQWNWGAVVGHIPYQFAQGRSGVVNVDGQNVQALQIDRLRIYHDQAQLMAQHPFSKTLRLEFGGGYERYSYDLERETFLFSGGQRIGEEREEIDSGLDALNLGSASAGLVGDNSYFGFTAPVKGQRFRVQVSPTIGDLDYTSVLGDYRRYIFKNPWTLAFRGLGYGRLGPDAENFQYLQPIFLSRPYFVRGYSYDSFDFSPTDRGGECADAECSVYSRLIGSKIVVGNIELRAPLFGTEDYGILETPIFPVDVGVFVDAGIAWDKNSSPDLTWSTDADAGRIPVVSTGITSRINVGGFAILEVYYAYPFQRPNKGWHFGMQIQPGW